MSARTKEKVSNIFRKILSSANKADAAQKNVEQPESSSAGAAKNGDSPNKRLKSTNKKVMPMKATTSSAQEIGTRRLMREYEIMHNLQHSEKNSAFTVELVNDNLYEWRARIYGIDADSKLAKDMTELNIPCIVLNLNFPDNYPFKPPFVRVVEPRIDYGYVMEGGAICMELLTPHGWTGSYTTEAILLQFAASITQGRGRVSRKHKRTKDYSKRAAEETFNAVVKVHDMFGWVTPPLAEG